MLGARCSPISTTFATRPVSDQRKSRKERRTAKLMHADLVKLGYDGSYERVAAFVREWKGERQRAYQTTDRGTFVPLVFASGEAFQFDWSEDWAYVGGERIKLQVAHIKLSHSRAFLVRAYLLQTHEMLFDAHWHAFRVFEGIPGRGIYDNMKTAVDKVGLGKKRDVNARFTAMTSHYVFDPEFCNPAAGWEKGQVEKNVRDARHRMWQLMPAFPDLSALNDWLEERCELLWAETAHGTLPGSIADVWEAEKPALMPLPTMFDGFVEERKRVSPTCLITFDRTRYSVPASFANRPVSLRIYPEQLVVVAEGHVICTHERIIDRSHRQPGRVIYDWRHYLAVVQRKPGALRNGAPFVEMPEPFRVLQAKMLRQPGVKLVNFWASWCPPCRAEHPTLTELAKTMPVYGIDLKDPEGAALGFLSKHGDPFDALATDPRGRIAIDWGVTAPPETFIIDGQGRILYRHAGPLVRATLGPLFNQATNTMVDAFCQRAKQLYG